MHTFRYNLYCEVRPYRCGTESKDNPYSGLFMVKFEDGSISICSYTFPKEDDLIDDTWEGKWIRQCTNEQIVAHDNDKWYPMDYIFDMLDGIPTPYSCWEFGYALAEFAIPALDNWIKKGCSFDPTMTKEEWDIVRLKIKRAFEVSVEDMEGDPDDITLSEHDKIREEGFSLMAKYYLSLWD